MGKKDLFKQQPLLKRVGDLVRAGVIEPPVWLDIAKRHPPVEVAMRGGKKPPAIEFPEDRLMQSYYARHPEAKLEPIWLDSTDPPTGKRYALRQLVLMQHGMSRTAARRQVDAEFAAAKAAEKQLLQEQGGERATFGARGAIAAVQAEEERELFNAIKELRKKGRSGAFAAAPQFKRGPLA